MTTIPDFSVISGRQSSEVLRGREPELVDLVCRTYLTHADRDSVNPPSYFLRFPDRPSSRIIALPAALGGQSQVAGVKWISSFPENVAAGFPRASAVLILNNLDTGYPFACLESSIISASRTAASAALAAEVLSRGRARPARVGFFGTGLIARYVHTFLAGTGWGFEETRLFDLSADSTDGFAKYLADRGEQAVISSSSEDLVRHSDLVIFATVAGAPHVHDPSWFDHHPVVLHVSLRDLDPAVLLTAYNVVDDVEHCLKADTSPHLTEQLTGNREFLAGTLAEVITGELDPPADRTVIFSPFGLGVLDLAVGRFVHERVRAGGDLQVIDDFFYERQRHG